MAQVTDEKLRELAALVERQQIERLKEQNLACEANINNCRTRIIPGRKYTKIDVGTSGKLMIDNETGIMYGIKAYGKVHKGHVYGDIDSFLNWYWGEYYPQKAVLCQ